MNRKEAISRREFLKTAAAAGGGLLVSLYLSGCRETPATASSPTQAQVTPTPTPGPQEPPDPFAPNVFVEIDPAGMVTVTVPRVEMGQGVRTALPMILADELGADWERVRVVTARADRAYGRQQTTGSHSVEDFYFPLRRAGAVARTLLIAAAAQMWNTDPEKCTAEQGKVIHQGTDDALDFGKLVGPASALPVPSLPEVSLKSPEAFQIIGEPIPMVDAPAMVSGRASYGMDVKLPGMLYASIARCPVPGGKMASFDPSGAEQVPGVREVLEFDQGVAVLAENTWAAFQGRDALQVTWDRGPDAVVSTESIRESLQRRVENQAARAASSAEGELFEAVYEVPYLAHATMEPMNCTADVRSGSCEVWAPTQNPEAAKTRAVSITRLGMDDVVAHIPLMGGGFGRRSHVDYVEQAVRLSAEVERPVQVVWTREDDFLHDFLHPFSLSYAAAGLDDPTRIMIRSYKAETPMPTGIWRSVDNIQEAFAHECFVDELAAAMGRDCYPLRREMLDPEQQAVLDLAIERAGWEDPAPEGVGRGLAFHSTWDVTHVAQVAEVRVDDQGEIRVQRVVCALDCGLVINPDIVAAQIEGGIVMGLTAALKGEITIAQGQVQQRNFHEYPLLSMQEMPEVEVYILPSERDPEGVGEMGIPPVAPAVANAVYAACGERLRKLPLRIPQED